MSAKWLGLRSRAQHAFRKTYQVDEVLYILRSQVEKAEEFRTPPLFILDGDISKAYDYTRHSVLTKRLQENGMPTVLVAAIVREVRRQASVVALGGARSEPIFRKRSIVQGDPNAPDEFNVALDGMLVEMEGRVQEEGWGSGYRMAFIWESWFLPTTFGCSGQAQIN